MTATTIHLLRHGAPVRTERLLGWSDEPSTREGLDHCLRRAAGIGFERVETSPLLRALAAAELIAAERGFPVVADERWRELDFGAWTGLATEELNPLQLSRFYDDPDENAPPGGETWSALTARVSKALSQLQGETLVVTHAGPMRAALSLVCGLDLRQLWAFDLPYGALVSLRFWDPYEPGRGQIFGLFA